jgi:hypothetical protein
MKTIHDSVLPITGMTAANDSLTNSYACYRLCALLVLLLLLCYRLLAAAAQLGLAAALLQWPKS